ncbi:hypothetical protein PAGU2638_26000 [Lysobacter sp. PAGU 2638]
MPCTGMIRPLDVIAGVVVTAGVAAGAGAGAAAADAGGVDVVGAGADAVDAGGVAATVGVVGHGAAFERA